MDSQPSYPRWVAALKPVQGLFACEAEQAAPQIERLRAQVHELATQLRQHDELVGQLASTRAEQLAHCQPFQRAYLQLLDELHDTTGLLARIVERETASDCSAARAAADTVSRLCDQLRVDDLADWQSLLDREAATLEAMQTVIDRWRRLCKQGAPAANPLTDRFGRRCQAIEQLLALILQLRASVRRAQAEYRSCDAQRRRLVDTRFRHTRTQLDGLLSELARLAGAPGRDARRLRHCLGEISRAIESYRPG